LYGKESLIQKLHHKEAHVITPESLRDYGLVINKQDRILSPALERLREKQGRAPTGVPNLSVSFQLQADGIHYQKDGPAAKDWVEKDLSAFLDYLGALERQHDTTIQLGHRDAHIYGVPPSQQSSTHEILSTKAAFISSAAYQSKRPLLKEFGGLTKAVKQLKGWGSKDIVIRCRQRTEVQSNPLTCHLPRFSTIYGDHAAALLEDLTRFYYFNQALTLSRTTAGPTPCLPATGRGAPRAKLEKPRRKATGTIPKHKN
jgi:hypothetical protein